ncbi:hypothetical protein L6R52_43385, partial [Myxococcota bacterium]|nr:hypothetical protein [Myxococcota bacterium]
PATPGFAAGRLAIADAATELHAPPLDDTPIVAIPPELAAPRAWGDPASLAPPPWGMAPHGAPTSTATAHPAAHSAARPDPGPTVPIVEVHAPVLRFGPIEKGILILAGFSIVAVIISTIFHSI